MKVDLSIQELQVLIAPRDLAQAEVARLSAEVARLQAQLAGAAPTASASDSNQYAIINALTHTCVQLVHNNKIGAIKVVREMTGLGLKEAKDIVEGTYSGPGVRRSA